MKTIKFIILSCIISMPLSAAVYEASTLHNAVSRAETVQQLFIDRWGILKDKNFYIDLYGKINWIFDFNVNTYNSGNGKYEPTDLNLVRTYGSLALVYPVTEFRATKDDSDLLFSFSTTGFHYGLTRNVEIDRGSAGSETTTDYKHSQFFDDIYAFSILWRPYFILHAGYIFNKEYMPKDDGTMSYSDPVSSSKKKFLSTTILEFLDFSINIHDDRPEYTKVDISINKLISLIEDSKKPKTWDIKLRYEYSAAYNDELYDSAWAKRPKDTTFDNYTKDSAKLNVASLLLYYRLTDNFTFDALIGFQKISQDIYTKEPVAASTKIDVSPVKEWYLLFNYEPLPDGIATFKAYTGMSWFWDPAVSIHRDKKSGNGIYGWVIGFDLDLKYVGVELKANYNFSSELKKLVEASDKWAVEGSVFARI
jgi:hypothetical protein